jgi:hypothetical protein
MEVSANVATRHAAGRAAKRQARLRAVGFQPGQSGNPAGGRLLKDQAEALYRTMAADIRPQTPTDEILLRQASLMLAKAARFTTRKDADSAVRLVSEARWTIATLRRHIPKRGEQEESLAGYLASRYGDPAERDEQTRDEAPEAAGAATESPAKPSLVALLDEVAKLLTSPGHNPLSPGQAVGSPVQETNNAPLSPGRAKAVTDTCAVCAARRAADRAKQRRRRERQKTAAVGATV